MITELLAKIAEMTQEQIEAAARAASSMFRRLTVGLLVRAEEPLPTLSLDQLYTAIRILDPEADVHFPVDMVLPPGYSGTAVVPLPAGIYCVQRYGIEWGDPVIKLKWSIDSSERVAVQLHNVPPSPMQFEFAKYWVKREAFYLYTENTDTVNSAEFHLNVCGIFVKASDWERWGQKIRKHAVALLVAPPPPPPAGPPG